MDFAKKRRENDELLLPRIDEIRAGQAFDALEPFARAYLGLYFKIDAELSPDERVATLANDALKDAVLEGFVNALQQQQQIPDVASIAQGYLNKQGHGTGFIVLAGMDRVQEFAGIPDAVLQSAIAFHYTNTVFHDNHWLSPLLQQRPELAGQALLQFWLPQIDQGAKKVEGLRDAIYDPAFTQAMNSIVLTLLQQWSHCKSWTLRTLLQFALQHSDLDALLALARQRFAEQDKVNIKHYVYWLTVYLVLAPDEVGMHFVSDMGRTKDRILPLFDFMLRILRSPARERLPLKADTYAHCLRVVAPRFHPSYDDFGQMEEKSKNVIWLFEQFKTCKKDEALCAIDRLQKVRVMRIYSDVMSSIANEVKTQ